VRTIRRVGARPSTKSSPKIAFSTIPKRASTVAATRLIALRARSGLLTLTFDINQLQNRRNWAMAGGSNGYRAALVRRQLTPGLISSLPGTAGLPPFISFSTSYPELDSAGAILKRCWVRAVQAPRGFLYCENSALGSFVRLADHFFHLLSDRRSRRSQNFQERCHGGIVGRLAPYNAQRNPSRPWDD
jgi:hypothetical protein